MAGALAPADGVPLPAGAEAALIEDAGLERDTSGVLLMDGVALEAIAAAHGTPAYVYSVRVIRERYARLEHALAPLPHRTHYAVKANSTLAILRLLRDLGAGADIVSAGELHRALAAGFAPADVVFSGVGKTTEEMQLAVASDLGSVNVESLEELRALADIAAAAGRTVRVGIRVNPDVSADTHPYIATGSTGIKFGVPEAAVPDAVAILRTAPQLQLVTLAMHLGSQIVDVAPYAEGARRLAVLVAETRAAGLTSLRSLDIGGGLGIRYREESPLDPEALASAIAPAVRDIGLVVHLEPGRFLVGSAGVFLTRVLYRKVSGPKAFVIVDGGMNDLFRPSHYQAYHAIVEAARSGRPVTVVDVVGPVCETGDFLALDRVMPDVAPGALLAVLGAGAYGFTMASNYNTRPRPAEILVDGGRFAVARTREPLADLLRGEDPTPFGGAGA